MFIINEHSKKSHKEAILKWIYKSNALICMLTVSFSIFFSMLVCEDASFLKLQLTEPNRFKRILTERDGIAH